MAEIRTGFFQLKRQIEDALNRLFEGTRIEFPVIRKNPVGAKAAREEPGSAGQCPVHIEEEEKEGKNQIPGADPGEQMLLVRKFPQPRSPLDNFPAGKEEAPAKKKPALQPVLRRR